MVGLYPDDPKAFQSQGADIETGGLLRLKYMIVVLID